jgi:tetratricopeptide (TPR) repeat protein
MAVAKVLRLDEYRDRREHRLGLARAFSHACRTRTALFEHLEEVAGLTGADRVAVVWIDEFSPELVHADHVVDLLADRPRRRFAAEPLHKAWELGIPGTYDEARDRDALVANTFAVALGSDGSRAWFLCAESVRGRPELDRFVRDRVLFLAGEVSSIALHRDLDADGQSRREPGFPGWRTLKDLEGHETDVVRARIVARRFIVLRLGAALVEEGLLVSDERRSEQVSRARRELEREPESEEGDGDRLEAVLAAYESDDLARLGVTLIELGEEAERMDHGFGALDAYECAYEMGAAVGDARLAIDAARKAGRVLRRRARWADADRWYDVALRIAQAIGDDSLAARSLAGLGLVKRELGNLPAARERFVEALGVAEGSDDRETLASVHHDLMGLEHLAGDLDQALRHGWIAVNTYRSEQGRTRCMASMAGVLRDLGDLEAAEDAYVVVTHRSSDVYYRVYAYDALAHIAALRGDQAQFQERAAQCDALDWESGPHSAKAEILYYRGLSLGLLGHREAAHAWLARALEFAEEHDFHWVLFEAEAALGRLSNETSTRDPSLKESRAAMAPFEVREGLQAMRAELAGLAG